MNKPNELKLNVEELEERIAPGVLTVGPPANDASADPGQGRVPGSVGPSVAVAAPNGSHGPVTVTC